MNLIELSNQLKDVPDQALLREVQSPSGAYPAYLVVTEMTRRKRMRDQAQKESPTTSVAEDLMQQDRQRIMQGMAQLQAQKGAEEAAYPYEASQMPIPRQMMNQSRLNAPRMSNSVGAGLMAMPQAAGELAGQDVIAAQPVRRMARGGIVAFGGGGLNDPESIAMRQAQVSFPGRGPDDPVFKQSYDIYLGEARKRAQAAASPAGQAAELARVQSRGGGPGNPEYDAAYAANLARLAGMQPKVMPEIPVTAKKDTAPPTGLAGVPTAPPVRKAVPMGLPSLPSGYGDIMFKNIKDIRDIKELTPEEREAAGAKGAARYEQQIPSRYGFLEEEIANRTKDIEQRKDANINQALMQAGLGIMGSRSPYFMRAVSEGGLSALGAYRQGLKDIQEGEKDLLQSKATLANAQTLYDQGKYAAAEREKEDALKFHDRGIARKETENAMLAQITKNNIDEYNARIAGAKLPYEQRLLAAHAQYYGTQSMGRQPDTTASPAEANAAHELATKQVYNEFFAGQHKDAPATPKFNQRVNNKMQQILLESGKPYKFKTINQVPDVKPPVVRGDPNSPLRLP